MLLKFLNIFKVIIYKTFYFGRILFKNYRHKFTSISFVKNYLKLIYLGCYFYSSKKSLT